MGKKRVVEEIIDRLIEKKVILPEHRNFAIEVLDSEMRRKTKRYLEEISSVAVAAGAAKKAFS